MANLVICPDDTALHDRPEPFYRVGVNSNVPESNCFAYLLLYAGQLVAQHMGLRFLEFRFSSPVRRLDQPQGSGGLGEH